ncbi:hypothetical protein HQ47_01625 [Porphyromonas macacae]|uniref:DUF4374 domain-containing protein n=1 Tax=Porphyromonas macacae TaxID=28115 RepID=A0A0A2EDW7_9PORP|nr:hypothetical protein [Porphyromonas macacae]KGN75660.1 hypothetical protein HQ47_01625 [Porphyromonas macacae]
MKVLKLFTLGLLLLGLFSCNCDKDEDGKDPILDNKSHYDIWVSIGGNGGMGSSRSQLVAGVSTLLEGDVDFINKGTDVTAKLNMETIVKGRYYYQINKEDNFGKYEIIDGAIKVVKEFPYSRFAQRKYCFAWIDSKTLLLMGASGDKKSVLWSKIDTETMKETEHGTIEGLPAPKGKEEYTTSGLLAYRKADNKLIYTFAFNKMKKEDKKFFHAAFINPSDMKVEAVVKEERAEKMAGTAYGELLQSKAFFDEKGDYYLACVIVLPHPKSSTIQHSKILRIKAGEKDFDKTYEGFNMPTGKLVTIENLGKGKALLYIQDPAYLGLGDEMNPAIWGNNYNCYYAVLDIPTNKVTDLKLPASSGTFSQRSFVKNGKAFIGVNPEKSQPVIYYYDVVTGKLTPGLKIKMGYSFDRIVPIEI